MSTSKDPAPKNQKETPPQAGKPEAPKVPAPLLIEELTARALGPDKLKESRIFAQFMEKVAPIISLGSTGIGILNAFSSIDLKAERVGQVIKENPYYESFFLKVIE